MIGNDIVDLAFFESPRCQHVGYLDRVCTPAETLAVRQSKSPGLSLAIAWASKEAAYKLFSGLVPGCHFVPRSLVTSFRGDIPAVRVQVAQVSFGESRATIQVTVDDEWVHAIATLGASTLTRWNVRKIAVHGSLDERVRAESVAVRCLAKELLAETGYKGVRLEFAGKIPALAGRPGESVAMGVSLSHHGAFVAAAIGWPGNSFGSSSVDGCRLPATTSSGEPCFTCTA